MWEIIKLGAEGILDGRPLSQRAGSGWWVSARKTCSLPLSRSDLCNFGISFGGWCRPLPAWGCFNLGLAVFSCISWNPLGWGFWGGHLLTLLGILYLGPGARLWLRLTCCLCLVFALGLTCCLCLAFALGLRCCCLCLRLCLCFGSCFGSCATTFWPAWFPAFAPAPCGFLILTIWILGGLGSKLLDPRSWLLQGGRKI